MRTKLVKPPVYLIGIFLATCLLLSLTWRIDWSHLHSIPSDKLLGNIKGHLKARQLSRDDSYIRDEAGYLYPKGYYEFERTAIAPSVHDFNLKGRHSDDVMPVCKKYLHGAGKEIEAVYDYRIPPFNFTKNHKNPCWYEKTKKSQTVLKCIPYFYFIGTPKAGTTDLYFRITQHPDVTQCGAKERRFFDRQRFVKDSWRRMWYYIKSYDKAAQNILERDTKGGYNTMIFGDGSPTYAYNNVKWVRFPGNEGCLEPRITCVSYIHYMNPAAKLVLIMRNPVDRLYSSYLYNYQKTGALRTPEEFHDWASKAINAHTDCFQKHPFRACLYSAEIIGHTVLTVSASIYSRLIMDVLKLFPRDQLHVIKMEDYSADTATHLSSVFDYLGLAPVPSNKMEKIVQGKDKNRGPSYKLAGPMWNSTRKMLYQFYRPFNLELAFILNDDKYLWHEDL